MIRPRSYSFDDSVSPTDLNDLEESQLEKELAQKIAARKERQKKEGFLFIRESSWLSMCCGVFAGSWQKRFAQLTTDRLLLKLDEKSQEQSSIPLKHCKVSISEVTGHNGRHNCLQIHSFGYEAFLSFETNEELRAWAIALNYTVELLEKSSIRSANLQLYLRGVRILEEKSAKRARFPAFLALLVVAAVEAWRTWWQEEWERQFWTPEFVLKSRREHYVNDEYNRLKLGLRTTFEITNWEKESKMVYHVDTQGNHRYEKIVLPAYHYGRLDSAESVERFYRLSVYNMNKDKRNDLDNFLRAKTVSLGDWLIAFYYKFNVWTQSFDPFFYKAEFFYELDRESLFLNLQTADKPRSILRVLQWAAQGVKKIGEVSRAPKSNT